ncbi:hypothetical protein HHI36_016770 [Cryptolaemus montrouzieri]|uniref:Uncharacterized protein n=1 Tax=Cryptolaemus montrouzieri TaxID=559131 RepID=A0ABD2NLG7_9CUCU
MLYVVGLILVFDTVFLDVLSAHLQDSMHQWEKNKWICGWNVDRVSKSSMNYSSTQNNYTSSQLPTLENADSVEIFFDDSGQQNITITYEDFQCCLKNIIKNIRNTMEREECLKSFFKCVSSLDKKHCTTRWRYYINLLLHDDKFKMILVFILLMTFLMALISIQKCDANSELANLIGPSLRR